MLWKSIFWLSAVFISLQIAWFLTFVIFIITGHVAQNYSFLDILKECIYLVVAILSLMAIYGYAYKSKILFELFWKLSFLFAVLVNIYIYVDSFLRSEWDITMLVALIWVTISITAFYLYAYKTKYLWDEELDLG